ncbi:MAG: hypothetical protein N3F04_03875 [Candidatus Nezhaarchaeota archaeon]|nr:hypothetical protein [Candidatus Nezhaarchaeota archaeon]MCX8141903.1 hypothetical protein [Candidatus Nezhaarchaeota archaeon]MDW8050316.1 hypothetical protein [Nitrososphaerota archaeon]
MDFCPNCGALLKPMKKNGKAHLTCRRCSFSKVLDQSSTGYFVKQVIGGSKHRTIGVIEEKEELKERVREEVREVSQERIKDLMDLLDREDEQAEPEE